MHSYTVLFSQFSEIPCIVLTELNDIEIAADAAKKVAQDYIPKENVSNESVFRAITYSIIRKQFEREIRKSEEQYRQLFTRSKDAIYNSTPQREFIDLNPAGLSLCGYKEEELSNLSVRDLYLYESDRNALVEVLQKMVR